MANNSTTESTNKLTRNETIRSNFKMSFLSELNLARLVRDSQLYLSVDKSSISSSWCVIMGVNNWIYTNRNRKLEFGTIRDYIVDQKQCGMCVLVLGI